jgi:hypothetical protein
MGVLFLLPGLISLILVIRGRVETAFLSVYLPALILTPNGYAFRLPHLPGLSVAEWALVPIACVAIKRLIARGKPSVMDVLVVLFVSSSAVSEVLRENVMNDGIFLAIDNFISFLMAYAVGRSLIEPGRRLVTVRRFVILVLMLTPVGLIDWRLGQNVYGIIGERVFGSFATEPFIQMRAGHGRVAATFNDAELAGIVFGITFALNSWLVYLSRKRTTAGLGPTMTALEKYHIPGLVLFALLYMTQSRGPLIAVGAAFLILQISRFKNTRLATCIVAILMAVGAYGGYVYFSHYTNVSNQSAVADEQQGSALYRRQMNVLYQPIVKQGGWLGWGRLSYPTLPGMRSIDNEFLRSHLAYGTLGWFFFILVMAENFRSLVTRSWQLRSLEDRAFAISMLGAIAVFWITITSVYMGEQLPQIAFLLMGWSQSIAPGASEAALVPDAAPGRFAFRRVFH